MTNEVQLDGFGLTQMIRPVPPFDTSIAPADGQALVWDATLSKYRPRAGVTVLTPLQFGGVGSGSVDDSAAVNAAIAAASAGKVPLYLPPGYSWRCDSQLVLASDLTMYGGGAASVISGNLASLDALIRSPLTAATTNVTLRDFKIDRTGTNVQHGIRIRNCTGLRIQNLDVIGSHAASYQGGAIVIGGFASPTSGETCRDVVVSGCYFEAADNFCVQFGSVIGGVITGNRAKDCYREVYGVEPGSGFEAANIAITGNVVQTGSTHHSTSTDTGVIVVTESSGGTIREVAVTGNAVEGTSVISANKMAGILVIGGDAVTVSGNVVRNMNGAGISVGTGGFTTTGTLVVGNVVRDCNQGGNSTPDDVGVKIRNATSITIASNRITGSTHRVGIEETSSPVTAGNLIAHNHLAGNAARVATLAGGTVWDNNLFTLATGKQEVITGLLIFDGRNIDIGTGTGTKIGGIGSVMAFYGNTPIARPAVTGSRGGNAALASLLTQLAALGLVTDSTTA
jgi:hypothetical protein